MNFSNVILSLSNEAKEKRNRFHECKDQKPDRQNLAGVRRQGEPPTAGQEQGSVAGRSQPALRCVHFVIIHTHIWATWYIYHTHGIFQYMFIKKLK